MATLQYALILQSLGQNFLSTKYKLMHSQALPSFLHLYFLTSAAYLKEINYWYFLLFLGQSPGFKQQPIAKKRKNFKVVSNKKKTLLIVNTTKFNYTPILRVLEKQFLFLKNPAHMQISKFSQRGEKCSILHYCETYKVQKTARIQKQNNFYISDVSLVFFLKIYAADEPTYFLNFLTINKQLTAQHIKQKLIAKTLNPHIYHRNENH